MLGVGLQDVLFVMELANLIPMHRTYFYDVKQSRRGEHRAMRYLWYIPIVSVVMLFLVWWRGILPRPIIPAFWCAVAFLLQGFSERFSLPWTMGLVTQAVIALYLAVKLKLSHLT